MTRWLFTHFNFIVRFHGSCKIYIFYFLFLLFRIRFGSFFFSSVKVEQKKTNIKRTEREEKEWMKLFFSQTFWSSRFSFFVSIKVSFALFVGAGKTKLNRIIEKWFTTISVNDYKRQNWFRRIFVLANSRTKQREEIISLSINQLLIIIPAFFRIRIPNRWCVFVGGSFIKSIWKQ